jgi:hypothetical protein
MELRKNGHAIDIRLLDTNIALARYGTILNTSITGLLIEVCPGDVSSEVVQNKLPLSCIEGQFVLMTIDEMNLQIDGRVVRFCYNAQEMLEIAIDFSANTPVYWRECFADLLPTQGEFEQGGFSL